MWQWLSIYMQLYALVSLKVPKMEKGLLKCMYPQSWLKQQGLSEIEVLGAFHHWLFQAKSILWV